MSRPRWFPPLRPDTLPADRRAILDCQGGWWLYGSSACKKPELCIADRKCYFVIQAARTTQFDRIKWSPGFDSRQRTMWS